MPAGDRVEKSPKARGQKETRKSTTKKVATSAKAARGTKAARGKPTEGAFAPVAPPRLLEKYRKEAMPALVQEFGYGNAMEIPRIEKIVLNIGLGEALTNPRAQESALRDLTTISGQKPVVTRARKSIAGFKLRSGMAIGVKVTLRGRRMYEFLDKFLSIALPRIRDFRGLSRNAGDGRGNYSIGLRDQSIFPEIDYNQIDRMRGLQVTMATTSKTDEECVRLLELMGMPFSRIQEAVAASA